MDFLNLLFEHFWEVIIFLFLFGGSIGGALRWFIRHSFEHRERMQEKRNEELRLRIQLEQVRNEHADLRKPLNPSDPSPKDISWDEQAQTTYEQGYQQQQIHQR
jgi:hypothetical protein